MHFTRERSGTSAVAGVIVTLSLLFASVAPVRAEPPSSPGSLRHEVYSDTAVELFWSRSSDDGGAVTGYEIRIDDEIVTTVDALSYFIDTLQAGRRYEFAVTAIDRDGERSEPARVSVVVGERPSDTSSLDEGSESESPPPPANLRASVYSPTAAEISWNRPTTVGMTHEIVRDGVTLATTDGTSHFDDTLTGGRVYTYEVIAIDPQGRRSAAAVIVLDTPGVRAGTEAGVRAPPQTSAPAITEPPDLYTRDGYGTVDIVRMDVRTVTEPGVCTVDEQSGCTLADVVADIDGSDDFTVEIPVRFRADDFRDDGSTSNAELRQRGSYSRLAPQKSFRVKLDSSEALWRGERRIQLNKNPYDVSRIRNKLAFDLMRGVPHLPSLRTQFVNLWIDDGEGPVDYGLYTHAEYVGKEFLVNRGRNTDDRLYKAEKFLFSTEDLAYFGLDENGEPLDIDRFESRLEIKRGEDHRTLVEMVEAVSDPALPFESVLARYFDEDNVLAWVTVNLLLHQVDAVTHNFYLYNPVGSETFYFVPWDYDGAFGVEAEPAPGFATDALERRLSYGYAKGAASVFLARYYRLPGIHERILAKADELRAGPLADGEITERATRYAALIAPVAGRAPDIVDNAGHDPSESRRFADYVARSHRALRMSYRVPLPPSLWTPVVEPDRIVFRWDAAHDPSGSELRYDLEVSSSPAFGAGNRILLVGGIDEAERGGYAVDRGRIGSGTRYVRLVARAVSDPDRFWQIDGRRLTVGGTTYIGVRELVVP